MSTRHYLYPLWVRIWHWLNALTFLVLIPTGISMHFADVDRPIVISFQLATYIHNVAGVVLTDLWLFFAFMNIVSGNWRHYVPPLKGLIERLYLQIRFYLVGIMRGEPHPFPANKKCKFNPMQQLAYDAVMFGLVPLICVTGVLLLLPDLLPGKILGIGSVWIMAVGHTILAFFGSIFLLVHVYLGSTGDTLTSLLKGMITGWHEEHEEHAPHAEREEPAEAEEQKEHETSRAGDRPNGGTGE